MHDYLLMGGYAGFIWPAYGVAALVLVAFALDSWRRAHQATMALRRLESEVAAQADRAAQAGRTAQPGGTAQAKGAASPGTPRHASDGNKAHPAAVSGKPDQPASDQSTVGS